MLLRIAFILVAGVAACGGKGGSPGGATTGPSGAAEAPPPTPLADPTSESLGGIDLGAPAAKAIEVLGEPGAKTEVVEWEATGDRISEWTWATGEVFDMGEVDGGFAVHGMLIRAPSKLTTSRGIGIGATFEQVDATYKEFRGQGREEGEPEQWDLERGITVGSIYGGTMINFENGKVSQIFVGASAE